MNSENSQTLVLLLSGCSACLMLVVALLLGMVGYVLKQLVATVRNLCERVVIVETVLKCDTNFSSKLGKAAGILLLAALLFTGCANPPSFLLSHTTDKQGNEHYEVSPAVKAVTGVTSTLGPWGMLATNLATSILSGWAAHLNSMRKLKKHIRSMHPPNQTRL